MKRCVIIGSGLSGLSIGAVLSRNGYDVTVLEQSSQIGGCLQCFERGDSKFETGMHIVGSLDNGEVLSNYFNFLGIKNKIQLSRLDTSAYNTVKLYGEIFSFPNGQEAMVEYFGSLFPKEKDNLVKYWQQINEIATTTPYYNLNVSKKLSDVKPRPSFTSINAILDSTLGDKLLKEVLMGNISLYAARRNKTPFSSHAFINDFYNKSCFRIIGGSDIIAKSLAEEIKKNGGEIHTHCRATKAFCENGSLRALEINHCKQIKGDIFISTIHPALTVDLFENDELRPAYINRIKSIPNTISVFALNIKFRQEKMPYANTNYFVFSEGGPWELERYDSDTWPKGYLYMHDCHQDNPIYAKTGVIFAYMSADELTQWSNSRVGHREVEYGVFKKKKTDKLLSCIERDFPGIKDSIENIYSATPLTYRDYTLTPEGAMYGMAKDITLGIGGRITHRTKIPNLFLAGQNIKAHGVLGVLVSTIDVCETILGEHKVHREMVERNQSSAPTPPLPPSKSTIIMGGGIGGLFCGALLAKEGYKVTVLEKNMLIGGGLQCFNRFGVCYPTGIHSAGGFNNGEQLDTLCKYLGIRDNISFIDTTKDAFDEVILLNPFRKYQLPKGREAYIAYLCEKFPNSKSNIHSYIKAIYRLTDSIDLLHFRHTSQLIQNNDVQALQPADKFIDNYISDPELKVLLYYLTPMYAGERGKTPAYIHALITIMHIEGTRQFTVGSQQLANALRTYIESRGGLIKCGEKIKSITSEDNVITNIITDTEHFYSADSFISNIPINGLLKISPKGSFTSAFRKRITDNPLTYSAFKAYLRIEDETIPFTHSSSFCSTGNVDIWSPFDNGEDNWPNLLLVVFHPDIDCQFVKAITLVSPMPFDWVKKWENTTIGHRGSEYLKWKEHKMNVLIELLEQTTPGITSHIINSESSSPLTIKDYLGSKDGAMFGLSQNCNSMSNSFISAKTKFKNLFLTGQDVNIHGLCGASMSAIQTVEAILDDSSLRTRILQYQ